MIWTKTAKDNWNSLLNIRSGFFTWIINIFVTFEFFSQIQNILYFNTRFLIYFNFENKMFAITFYFFQICFKAINGLNHIIKLNTPLEWTIEIWSMLKYVYSTTLKERLQCQRESTVKHNQHKEWKWFDYFFHVLLDYVILKVSFFLIFSSDFNRFLCFQIIMNFAIYFDVKKQTIYDKFAKP